MTQPSASERVRRPQADDPQPAADGRWYDFPSARPGRRVCGGRREGDQRHRRRLRRPGDRRVLRRPGQPGRGAGHRHPTHRRSAAWGNAHLRARPRRGRRPQRRCRSADLHHLLRRPRWRRPSSCSSPWPRRPSVDGDADLQYVQAAAESIAQTYDSTFGRGQQVDGAGRDRRLGGGDHPRPSTSARSLLGGLLSRVPARRIGHPRLHEPGADGAGLAGPGGRPPGRPAPPCPARARS